MTGSTQPQSDMPREQAPSLLVVDDDPVFRELMAVVFRSHGVETVLMAADGDEGEKHLGAGRIDVITLDLNMPNCDGVRFLQRLVRHGFEGQLVLISGEANSVLQSAARLASMLGLSCVAALSKPVDFEEVARIALSGAKSCPAESKPLLDIEAVNAGLRHSRLLAAYQPRINIASGELAGAEVLARMRDENGEFMDAAQMINLAEQNGRLSDITWRMIEIISEEAPAIFKMMNGNFRLSFNISASTLVNPQFPDQLAKVIRLSGMSPERFVVELTESRIPADPARALELLTRLRIQGFGLAVDDFGTGYSNIERMRMFPFTELKIDRSFMANAATDGFSRACIQTGIGLARELELRTVIEGVENEAMLNIARSFDIDEAQGYLFGKPMALREFLDSTGHNGMPERNPAVQRAG